ncbi:MAG: PD40 domain-containing protein [Planctomycetes bacterium]|nr:PD40 domain-containing protein [Planctomycetota bacterium]
MRSSFLLFPLLAAPLAAQSIECVTTHESGLPAGGSQPAMTPDATFVAFITSAALVPSDTNGLPDVYVRERASGAIERVSRTVSGADTDGESTNPSISADGRFVVFTSRANNLLPAPLPGGVARVYVRDRVTATTALVSASSGGVASNGTSGNAQVARDGRYVVFQSSANNLVANDANASIDVFRRDLQAGTTVCVTVDLAGTPRGGVSEPLTRCSLSADGRFVAFDSAYSALTTDDTDGLCDVFVRDMLAGVTTLVSVSSSGVDGDHHSVGPALSADGNVVAFHSRATNLVPAHGAFYDVYVHELLTHTTTIASVSSAGLPTSALLPAQDHVSISGDGRFVTFWSDAPDLVAAGHGGLFLRDRLLGTTRCIGDDALGRHGGGAVPQWVPVSDDGRVVAFTDAGAALVRPDTNGVADVFLVDAQGSFATFCDTDVSLGCPCAGAVFPGRACGNSVFADGAQLEAGGGASVSNDTVRLDASQLTGSACLFLAGDAADVLVGTWSGDGLSCVGGTLVRIGSQRVNGHTSSYPASGDAPLSVRLGTPPPGSRRYVQAVYRNAASFCTPGTSNRTNAVAVLFAP